MTIEIESETWENEDHRRQEPCPRSHTRAMARNGDLVTHSIILCRYDPVFMLA
jgi:hypothetical protein